MTILVCSRCGGEIREIVLMVLPPIHVLRCTQCYAEKRKRESVTKRVIQMPEKRRDDA